MLGINIIVYSVKMYSPIQNQRIKKRKMEKKNCFSNNYKNNKRNEENNKAEGAHGIQIIVFSVFSSACPVQVVPCVLHLGG